MKELLSKTKDLEFRIASAAEIDSVYELRYSIFNEELGSGLLLSAATCKDTDEYDQFCDHLIVLDRSAGKIVGTYRALRKKNAVNGIGFYSAHEFDLNSLLRRDDEVAEIGRSCVHSDYRDGSVISMLWAGLCQYMKVYSVRYLMGCGSIHSADPELISEIYAYLRFKDGLTADSLRIFPLESTRLAGFRDDIVLESIAEIQKRVPALLKGYIRAGAKICGPPAYDPLFSTTDFFLFFDVHDLEKRYSRHFWEK